MRQPFSDAHIGQCEIGIGRELDVRRSVGAVERADRGADVRLRGDHGLHGHPARGRHLPHRFVVRGVLHRDVERVADLALVAHVDRDHAVLLGQLARQEVQQLPREIDVMQRHPRHAELLREHACEGGLGKVNSRLSPAAARGAGRPPPAPRCFSSAIPSCSWVSSPALTINSPILGLALNSTSAGGL